MQLNSVNSLNSSNSGLYEFIKYFSLRKYAAQLHYFFVSLNNERGYGKGENR